MTLYLVRHGRAMSEKDNPERPLTEKGRADAAKLADFLKPAGISVDVIWHSGKTRAAQTAEIVGSVVKAEEGITARKGLAPNDPVEDIAAEISAGEKDIMIVGHLPFVSRLASYLISGRPEEAVGFNESAIACLERDHVGKWRLTWMVHPGILQNGSSGNPAEMRCSKSP